LLIPITDVYETPAKVRPSFLSLLLVKPELRFYVPLFFAVLSARLEVARGKYNGDRFAETTFSTLGIMERAGLRFKIEGMDNFRSFPGPAVFISNHMSTLETFLLPAIVQPSKPVSFVVKEQLINYPLFGPILGSCNPIAVSRKNARQDLATVLSEGKKRLENGISMVVFPQTTRSNSFDPAQFNTIGTKLALRAGVPVVPLAVKTDAWANGRKFKDFGPIHPSKPVHFKFSKPIIPEGKGENVQQKAISFISKCLEEWGGCS